MYTRNKEGPRVLHLSLLLAHAHSKTNAVGLPQCAAPSVKETHKSPGHASSVTAGISHPPPVWDAVMRSAWVRDTTIRQQRQKACRNQTQFKYMHTVYMA